MVDIRVSTLRQKPRTESRLQMAWLVGIVVDQDFHEMEILVRQMPIWAVDTIRHREASSSVRSASGEMWFPEPSFTLFSVADLGDREGNVAALIEQIELHHPQVAALEIVGLSFLSSLEVGLGELRYQPCQNPLSLYARFAKPLACVSGAKNLCLDADSWKTRDDVYDAFFSAVGAPSWHGRNFDALNDSIATGGINRIEVPYNLVVQHNAKLCGEPLEMLIGFTRLIKNLAKTGCPVDIEFKEKFAASWNGIGELF